MPGALQKQASDSQRPVFLKNSSILFFFKSSSENYSEACQEVHQEAC
jgi:hypothetical protein